MQGFLAVAAGHLAVISLTTFAPWLIFAAAKFLWDSLMERGGEMNKREKTLVKVLGVFIVIYLIYVIVF